MDQPEKHYYAFKVVGIPLAFQILGQILQTIQSPISQQTCSCDLENMS